MSNSSRPSFSSLDKLYSNCYLTLPVSANVADVVTQMTKHQQSSVIVLKEDQVCGIITERDIVRLISNEQPLASVSLATVMTQNVVTIDSDKISDVFQISQLFQKHRIRHLPVLDDQARCSGVITTESLCSFVKPEYLLRSLCARDVMVTTVQWATPTESVLAIAKRMANHKISCIVIVDVDTNHPIGIITEKDITQFHALGLSLSDTSAQTVMSHPLKTVTPTTTLWSIKEQLQTLPIRRMVVKHDTGELAGLVTQTQILKLLNPLELYPVIEQMQATINEQTQQLRILNQKLQERNMELNYQALRDDLTRVSNRRRFDDCMAETWASLAQTQQELTLIMADIDHFKTYNDLYGHPQGDHCLRQVAQAIQRAVRLSTDIVARYGGEEFAVVLPNCGKQGAKRVLQKILDQVHQLHIPHTGSSIAKCVTISLGAAFTIPNAAQTPIDLIDLADKMLYRSKHQGRDRFNLQQLAPNSPEG